MSDALDNPYFQPSRQLEKSDAMPEKIPELIRTNETGDKVFFVWGHYYHWITMPEVFENLKFDWKKVETVPYMVLKKLDKGVSITMHNVDDFIKDEGKTEEKMELSTFTPQVESNVPTAPQEKPVAGFTSIIIPAYFLSYPLFHFTGNCIGSIHEHTDGAVTPYEIILVINGKGVTKFDNLEQTNCDKVIANDENMGYSHAVNQGIRVSRGEYIVLLNNDAQVFDQWLPDFHEALKHLDLVMATPMYGYPYARAREAAKFRGQTIDKPIAETFSDFRDFACVATRKNLFAELGLFDEGFFCYKEDLDLLNRMDKAGKKYASTKRVNIHHVIGSTSYNMNDVELEKEKGEALYRQKWGV